jgi:hypothetical protein
VNDAGTLVKSPSLRKHGPLARLAQNEAASGEPPLDDYKLRARVLWGTGLAFLGDVGFWHVWDITR